MKELSDKEVLQAAIEKAAKAGFDTAECWEDVRTLPQEYHGEYAIISSRVEKVIFNHEFCKALWGDEEYEFPADHCAGCECEDDYNESKGPAWQYHGTQMFLAEDRIDYLRKNLQ